tara:strand:+ start:1688 stop:2308 length:621 start_codon:yes stop_codon:yes gene_type:complete
MIQKFIFAISASAILIGCKADCPDSTIQTQPQDVIKLTESSPALQELIKSERSHIRGFTLGESVSKIIEKDEDLAAKDGINVNFTPDISTDYWADIEYFYDKNNVVTKLKLEINPHGSSAKEKDDLAEKIFNEMSVYFNGKYGNYVNTEDYKYVWNDADTSRNSLTVFTLDYEFPDEEISLIPNEEEGTTDTIFHGMTVLLKIKNM